MRIDIKIHDSYGWVMMETVCESIDALKLWLQQNKKTIEQLEEEGK